MTWQESVRFAWILPVLLMCSGCEARDAVQSHPNGTGYQKPADWQTECVGRWTIDVPPPIDFGAAAAPGEEPPWFVAYGSRELRKSGLDSGNVAIAGISIVEANRFNSERDINDFVEASRKAFERDRRRASYYPEIKDAYAMVPLASKNPGFAGHGHDKFDVAFVEPSDNRARLFTKSTTSDFAGNLVSPEEATRRAKGQAHLVVSNLLPRYSTRKPGDIPSVPGICTPYGFFADPSSATERDYSFNMRFRDLRHSNLILGINIQTRNPHTTGTSIQAKNIRDEQTPWDWERERARESRENCRPQQGTASRDLFGCAFAGLTTIRKHRDVEYLKLGNGQEARVLVIEYAAELNEDIAYQVLIETAGVENSPTEPRIVISARGIDAKTEVPTLHGKNPPPIDEAILIVRNLALSLGLRPGAIDPTRPVVDSMATVR